MRSGCADGLSISEISERLGVPRGTVGGWLRGRGEWYEIRECALCGERFIAASGRQRFCTPAHAGKHRRVFGAQPAAPPRRPSALDAYRERARTRVAELARVRAELQAKRAA